MKTLFGSMDDGGPIAVLMGLKRRKRRKVVGLRRKALGSWGKSLSNQDVVEVFLYQGNGDSGHLHSTGSILSSYAQPIAWWTQDGLLIDCSKSIRSMTTTKHRNSLLRALGGRSYKCLEGTEPKPKKERLVRTVGRQRKVIA